MCQFAALLNAAYFYFQVRSQIRKEIQDEIEKQRKSVLEDPNVREKLIQLEALRNQSGMMSASNVVSNLPVNSMPVTPANSSPAAMSMAAPGKDHRWYQQQMKNKQVRGVFALSYFDC